MSEKFSNYDFEQFEKQFIAEPKRTIDAGYAELARVLLDDIVRLPKRSRADAGESVVRMLERQYFDELMCRQLAVIAQRAVTIAQVAADDYLIKGEYLDGPLFAMGTFTGLTFVQVPQENYEPLLGLELGEYQIVSGEQPTNITRRLLVPILDVATHEFN